MVLEIMVRLCSTILARLFRMTELFTTIVSTCSDTDVVVCKESRNERDSKERAYCRATTELMPNAGLNKVWIKCNSKRIYI